MSWIQLLRLFHTIYYGRPPNVRLIQSLGLLAVKIGQTYAQRADFLNDASCRELAKLYRQTTPAPPETIDLLLEQATPPQWRQHFTSIEAAPFASASVGQVHRARLLNGDRVVVKLVRENFRDAFEADVAQVESALRWMVRFYPKLARVADPIGTLQNIATQTLAELDLTNEIAGQDQLQRIYQEFKDKYQLAKLRFPTINRPLSNERVMVTEFIDGPTFDELLESGNLRYETLRDLFQIHGFFLFCTGTFHGDIHPGNLILKGKDIYFLDTGAISRVPTLMRQGLFCFFDALVQGEFHQSADALIRMSRTPLTAHQRSRFVSAFETMYEGFIGRSVSELSLTKQMMRTVRLAVDHGMDFETGMYPIIKSLMYLDGMVLRCAPETDLMSDLKPFLEQFRPWVMDARFESHPQPTATQNPSSNESKTISA